MDRPSSVHVAVKRETLLGLATINSIATTQTLQENLQNLGIFAVTVDGDINKIHGKFDRNHLQFLACGPV